MADEAALLIGSNVLHPERFPLAPAQARRPAEGISWSRSITISRSIATGRRAARDPLAVPTRAQPASGPSGPR
jgi:hypothetical protein